MLSDTWILQKSKQDVWICEPAWSVICSLNYTWPEYVSFFFKKPQDFLDTVYAKGEIWSFPFYPSDRCNFLNLVCETGSRAPPCHPTFAYHKIFNNLLIHWMSVPGNGLNFFCWLRSWVIRWFIYWLSACLIKWLIACMTNYLLDWLIDRLISQLADWMIDWLIILLDWLINWSIDRLIVW